MHHTYLERRLINLVAGIGIPASLIRVAEFVYSRPLDHINARRFSAEVFADVDVYCMFVGYPRSGHSLVAQLLDAHPNMIIANEMDALGHVERGFSQTQIFSLLLNNSQSFARRGSEGKIYSYAIRGQWQGRFQHLKCIGDKKGGRSAQRIAHHSSLLGRLATTIDKEIRLVHVVRNPYDNIATLVLWKRRGSLTDAIDYYFSCVDGVIQASNSVPESGFITIRHESFVSNPRRILKSLCAYLGQEAPSDYLEACSEIVYESAHQSRYRIDWTDDAIRRVGDYMQEKDCSFFEGYAFEE